MRINNKLLAAVLFGLTALVAFTVQAQSSDNARFLSLSPPEGLPIIPVMEGWVANLDGTTSISFGIINRNDEATDIPLGENNFIEPAKYDGIQLTHFPAGRTVGAFAVTIPESEADIDVVWSIKTGDSDPLTVPGRRGASAYELDFILPRPQGALQPLVGIGEDGPQTGPAVGLVTIIEDYPRNPVGVGQQVLLTINATAPAVRAPEAPRFEGRRIRLVTGGSMAPFLGERASALAAATAASVEVVHVENHYFGDTVTIAGLLGGRDIIDAIQNTQSGDLVVLPAEALNADGIFIDDVPMNELEKALAPASVCTGHEITAALRSV